MIILDILTRNVGFFLVLYGDYAQNSGLNWGGDSSQT